MELIDAHVHLLHPEHFEYAWCRREPKLNRAFHWSDFRAALAGGPEGVTVTSLVFMEADVPESSQRAEVKFFSELAGTISDRPSVTAIVAAAWPESAKFAEQVEELAANPRVRGLRRVLHTMPEDLMTRPAVAENLRRLATLGLPFELCLRPHLLPAATALAAACPATTFVLDHAGVPDIAGGAFDPWEKGLVELARLPNVICKFSGLASCCDPRRPMTPQVRPYFDRCLEHFGPARLMWGSDWPLCNLTFDLAAWVRTSVELLEGVGGGERARIASGTARQVYRW